MKRTIQTLLGVVVTLLIFNAHGQYNTEPHLQEEVWYLQVHKNIDLFVMEVGQGDTVVVVHGGFGAEHGYLTELFKGMEKDFHLVFYDQRGSLRSPANDTLISAMSHVQDLEQLRTELGVNQLNLFGHSMGTWICSAYLEKYPDRVKRMTLMGLVWPKPDMNDEESELDDLGQANFSKFIQRNEVQQEMAEEGLDGQGLGDRDATRKWRIKFASANIYDISNWRNVKGGWVFYNQSAGTASGQSMPQDYNWIKVYRENPQVPITVINGSHDFVDFGGLLHKQWLSPLKHVSYHYIENAGHNSWIDQPKKVRKLLYQSLN